MLLAIPASLRRTLRRSPQRRGLPRNHVKKQKGPLGPFCFVEMSLRKQMRFVQWSSHKLLNRFTMEQSGAPQLDRLLSIKAEELTTLIDQGVVIEGILRVTNGKSVLISGSIQGGIESNGSIVINMGAVVSGSIRAKSLQVSGQVSARNESDVMDIEGPIVLTRTALIEIDAVSDGIQTEFGAVMNGRFRPREEKRMPTPAPVPVSSVRTAGVTVLQPFGPREDRAGADAERQVG